MLSLSAPVRAFLLHAAPSASKVSGLAVAGPLSSGAARRLHASRMQLEGGGSDSFGFYEERPPSEKQVAFAQRLAQQTAKSLPEAALQDMGACSQFIDECLSQTPPTERQLAFAQTIARDSGIDLPQQSTLSSKAVSDYINANQHLLRGGVGGGGIGGGGSGIGAALPTEKQIMYAVKLARDRNFGLTAEQLSSKFEMSQFIDSCVNGTSGTAAAGGVAMAGGGAAAGGAAAAAAFGAAPTPAAAPLENGVVAEAQAVDEAAAQAAPQQSEDMAALDALFNEPEGEEGEEGGGYLHEKDVPF